VRQLQVLLRVQAVVPGAHHRDGGDRIARRAILGALVRRAVDAQGQARDDGDARFGEGAREAPRVLQALGRRVAAAHDAEGARRQRHEAAQAVQHQRRVVGLQQRCRVRGVGEGEHLPRRAVLVQPCERGVEHGVQAGRRPAQGVDARGVDDLRERPRVLVQDLLRQAEGRQQAAGGLGPEGGIQREAQPGGQLVALHRSCVSAGWPRGRRRRPCR
jgi:hypothetical protein